LSSELDELRRRMSAIEEEQAVIREHARRRHAYEVLTEHDLADVRTAFHQQRTVLNAIGQTQADHSATLREQGKVLGALVIQVAEQARTLAEHGRVLGEHTIMLEEQGKMLCEQGTTLSGHTTMLRELLARLPAA
jgi:hypothetical protein